MRQVRDRRRRTDRHRASRKPLWQGFPVGTGMPCLVKAQQVVDQPLEAPGAGTGRVRRFGERRVAEGDEQARLHTREDDRPVRRHATGCASLQPAGHAVRTGCWRRNATGRPPPESGSPIPFAGTARANLVDDWRAIGLFRLQPHLPQGLGNDGLEARFDPRPSRLARLRQKR